MRSFAARSARRQISPPACRRSPNRTALSYVMPRQLRTSPPTPVALPLGRLKLSTRPDVTGSTPLMKTIGMVVVAEGPPRPTPAPLGAAGPPTWPPRECVRLQNGALDSRTRFFRGDLSVFLAITAQRGSSP